MSTREQIDSFGPPPEGSTPPELSLVPADAPEGAFFSARFDCDPDYAYLTERAGKVDTGATLLLDILLELGLLEPANTISEYKQRLMHIEEESEPLAEKAEKDEDDPRALSADEREKFTALNKEFEDLDDRVELWNKAKRRVYNAYSYYKDPDSNLDLDALYTKTAENAQWTLLKVVLELKGKLPRPREGARPDSAAAITQSTGLDAERVARILILEEIERNA